MPGLREAPLIIYEEGATQAQHDEAHAILDALTTAYPGHPWAVRVYGNSAGGGFFIKHMGFDGNYGMNCNKKTSFYSASALKRDVIFMAGEFLERAGLARGRGEDDPIVRVEGVPDKYQPAEFRKGKNVQNVVIAEAQLRDTPHRE